MNLKQLQLRAFCATDNGNEMLYFTEGLFDNGIWFESPSDHIDEYLSEPMLCAGAKDKNGKLVFDGDIVKNPAVMGVVRYVPKYCGFYLCYDKEAKYEFRETAFYIPLHQANLQICEIIGNIHENKELLQ